MMKMIFLLVSAGVLLSASAVPRNFNLEKVISEWDKHKDTTPYAKHMVENVKDLANNCSTDYNFVFCKVHEILQRHEPFNKTTSHRWDKTIVRNLKAFVTSQNQTCAVVLKDAKTTQNAVTIYRLMEFLVHCIQKFNMGSMRSP